MTSLIGNPISGPSGIDTAPLTRLGSQAERQTEFEKKKALLLQLWQIQQNDFANRDNPNRRENLVHGAKNWARTLKDCARYGGAQIAPPVIADADIVSPLPGEPADLTPAEQLQYRRERLRHEAVLSVLDDTATKLLSALSAI